MIKGFALDDARFLKGGKVNQKYFDELLERIKTIRTSERMAYQKITDLFIATAVDYNAKSEEAYLFFKIVQNKLHYAISGHTAAELIYERANADKEHMLISREIFCIKNGEITVNRLAELDEALKNIRVCDPAVGSGAFPLGMLNEIVKAKLQ